MKLLVVAGLLSLAVLSTATLSSCADKMTNTQSQMIGGEQGPPPAGVRDNNDKGAPANTDGMARPLAGGKANTAPDSMWNQNSPAEGKPF